MFPTSQRWGVNVHIKGAPKPGEAAQLGAAFGRARMDFRWDDIEKVPNVYNFSQYDALIGALEGEGVGSYWILDYGNPLYDGGVAGDDHNGPKTDAVRAAFTRFALAGLKRYAGRGIIWELWNEPNAAAWAPRSNASAYAALLNAVGAAVRADPGTAHETLVGPTTSGVDCAYLDAVGATGALRWLDGISVHPYRAGGPESALASYEQVRSTVSRHVAGGLPVLSGEWGWASCTDAAGTPIACHGGGGSAGAVVTREEQARRLARQWLVNDLAGVSQSIWYDWQDDGTNPTLGESNFGTVGNAYHNASLPRLPHEAYYAARTLQRAFGCPATRRLVSCPHFAAREPAAGNQTFAMRYETCYARVSLIGERQGTVCPGDKLAKAWPYSTAPQYLLANASLDE